MSDNIDVLDCIAAGEVDFGILLNPRTSKDVQVRGHREVVLGFVTPPGHSLVKQASRRFNACNGLPMVLPAEPLAICEQLRALEATSAVELSAVASLDSIQIIKSLVREGVGIGVLSSLDVMDEVAQGDLAFASIADSALKPLTLALCVGRARQLSGAANLALTRIETALTAAD